MIVFTKLSNILSNEKLFYALLIPFIAFFGIFGFVLYPIHDLLHPTTSADALAAWLPDGIAYKSAVAVYKNWTFSLFYVLAELWGSVMLSLLFWGFANEVSTVKEAKKYYPLFGLGANVALIFSGLFVRKVSGMRRVWMASGGLAAGGGSSRAHRRSDDG